MEADIPNPITRDNRASTSTTQSSATLICSQCSVPNPKNLSTRNLIVFIDGTSNQFGNNNTNVVKLLSQVDLKTMLPDQYTYYSSGIGTTPRSLKDSKRKFSDYLGLAIAWNLEEIVIDAYDWLARKYQQGDRIYFIGFSRGAYQVRVLAAMIHEVGLVRTPTKKQIASAYDHYEAVRSRKPNNEQLAKQFKHTFSWQGLRVHFIGVWDTVSSVGLVRQDVTISSSSSTAHACYFRHALALDERRVKFMPEYFHEIHSSYSFNRHSDRSDSNEADEPVKVKEVWFPGSHSDVGGKSIPGRPYQAGNISLLWMRQEVAACGLVLQPTDVFWLPEDIDFGTTNSMNNLWRILEYMPIKHQTSFFGVGEFTRKWHRLQPRCIIPGQTVHSSILYAYQPQVLPQHSNVLAYPDPEYLDLDGGGWEHEQFDETVAQGLLSKLSDQQIIMPIYLERLLFMLRFEKGKKSIRNVLNWKTLLKNLVEGAEMPLDRLFALVAYYEAGVEETDSHYTEFSDDIFKGANKCLEETLCDPYDGPRVATLLRPLTKHEILQERILSPEVSASLVKLLDDVMRCHRPRDNFGKLMDGFHCLLQYENTQKTLVEKLKERNPAHKMPRLSLLLGIEDTSLLIAVLRTVLTFAEIPEEVEEATKACAMWRANTEGIEAAKANVEFWRRVMKRIMQLARKKEGVVGSLAVEIWFALYDGRDDRELDLHDSHVRANVAAVFSSFQWEEDGYDAKHKFFRRNFGLGADSLNEHQKKIIGVLIKAVELGDSRARADATWTLVNLCHQSTVIRAHLCQTGLLKLFINQMQHKNSALLAATALADCLTYSDMKDTIKDNEFLPKHLVSMLRLDYFDNVISLTEGFDVFSIFLDHADIRKKILEYDILGVLGEKFGSGRPKDIRTSLLSLEILMTHAPDTPWVNELIDKGLEHLQTGVWQKQKVGVAILSSLALAGFGMQRIGDRIPEIIKMLTTDAGVQPNAGPTDSSSRDMPCRSPPQSMGPAWMLYFLAHDCELGKLISNSPEYTRLKRLHLSGTLVRGTYTLPWQVNLPTKMDVTHTLDNLISAIEERRFERGSLLPKGAVVPHLEHPDRLKRFFLSGVMWTVLLPPVVLGVSAVAITSVVIGIPGYAHTLGSRLWSQLRYLRVLDNLHYDEIGPMDFYENEDS